MASRSISRPFPGFESIYEFSEPDSGHAFRASIDLEDPFGTLRAEVTPPKPVKARWAMGRKSPGDIVWTTLAIPVIISERVVTILRDAGARGWGIYEVELVGSGGLFFPGYYGLSVHGRCGPLDDNKSVKMPRLSPGGIFPAWMGLYFDPETWDGSDFFMPEGSGVGFMFAIERIRRIFRDASIRNARFTALPQVEVCRLYEPPSAPDKGPPHI